MDGFDDLVALLKDNGETATSVALQLSVGMRVAVNDAINIGDAPHALKLMLFADKLERFAGRRQS